MAEYIEQAYGRHYLPSCTVCGHTIYKCDLPMCGVAKKASGGHVFWHDRCYQEQYGKTPDEYDEMKRAELQVELDPEQQRELDRLRKGRGMKTESIYALVFDGGKCWRERRDGYPTRDGKLFVCKRKHGKPKDPWESIDADTGMRVTGPFRTKKACEESLTDEKLAKLVKQRESHRYRGAVRANELVYARGSMPTEEYNRYRERYAAEELDKYKQAEGMKKAESREEPKMGEKLEGLKNERVCITGKLTGMTRSEAFTRLKLVGGIPKERFTKDTTVLVVAENSGNDKRGKAEKAIASGQQVKVVTGTEFLRALEEAQERKFEKAAKEKAGAKVEAKVTEHADVTAIEIAPKKEDSMEKRIAELEKELKATRKELEEVWKENETLKAKPKAAKPKAAKPKAEKPKAPKADAAEVVSLEFMQAWAQDRGLVASQKAEGCCIWVEGESKPYKEELVSMGFRFASKRKSWYIDPKRVA